MKILHLSVFLIKIQQEVPYDDNDSLKNSLWWKNSRALVSVALVKHKLAILRVISDLARKNNLHNHKNRIFDFDRSLQYHIFLPVNLLYVWSVPKFINKKIHKVKNTAV